MYNSIWICPGVTEFGVFTYVLGVKESNEIIFRVQKVAGNGEFQNGRQNGRRALSE